MNGKPPMEKWIYFDKRYAKSIDVNFNTSEPWVARIISLHFTPAEGEWNSPSAFLLIKTNANTTYSFNTYSKSKPNGIILPITVAENCQRCKSYYRGSIQGSDTLYFSILDADFNEVEVSRLTVNMLIAHESVAFLTF